MTTAALAPAPAPSAPVEKPLLTLEQHLKDNPWPAEWLKLGEPFNYLWRFDLDVTPEQLWPFVADTSSFNRRAGFAQMRFTEKDGKRFGESVVAGTQMRWEEVPWEWEFEKGLGNVRLYSEGFLQVVRTRYMLEPRGPSGCRLYVYMGVIPRGFKGRFFTKLGMGSMEKSFHTTFESIAASIQKKAVLPPVAPPPPFDETVKRRLSDARVQLASDGVDRAVLDKVLQHIEVTPDHELFKIRPKALARAWRVDERKLVVCFLHATRRGLFTLTWDVVCPHCRGSRAEVSHLGEIPKRGWCEVCGVDFETTNANSLEVSFHVHPSIRPVEKVMFCAAEPATKPHIQIQKTLGPRQSLALDTVLSPARYRMRLQGSMQYAFLDVKRDARDAQLEWLDTVQTATAEVREFPRITLKNTSGLPRTFVLERTEEDRDALRPVDLFGLQEFRDIFSEEAVASDLQLDIGQQTILFTDLVGSTKFYEEQGDTVAFAEVRRHFVVAFEIVQRHGGVIVKTIGDAVMAAFKDNVSALKASVELQQYFNGKRTDTSLRVRVTLHTGPCVAVNLNNNIDYFGSTVNFAAKLQATAEAGQVGFSEAVNGDAAVKQWLAAQRIPVEEIEFPLKWSGGKVRTYRVTVS